MWERQDQAKLEGWRISSRFIRQSRGLSLPAGLIHDTIHGMIRGLVR